MKKTLLSACLVGSALLYGCGTGTDLGADTQSSADELAATPHADGGQPLCPPGLMAALLVPCPPPPPPGGAPGPGGAGGGQAGPSPLHACFIPRPPPACGAPPPGGAGGPPPALDGGQLPPLPLPPPLIVCVPPPPPGQGQPPPGP